MDRHSVGPRLGAKVVPPAEPFHHWAVARWLAIEAVPVDMAPSSDKTRSCRPASGFGCRDNGTNAVNHCQESQDEIAIAGES